MTINFLFEITDLNSDYCGEMFFVQLKRGSNIDGKALRKMASNIASKIAGKNTIIKCLGPYTDEEAEMMGYDTY